MSYDLPVQGGKLKLKGSKPKTKKKKRDTIDSTENSKKVKLDEPEKGELVEFKPVSTKTKAEIAYEKQLKKRQKEMIKKGAEKSHRQKIEDFNKYLASLSEHHDIPKVGPG